MKVPLEITLRNLQKTPELETFIHKQVEKLNRYAENLVSCRVTIERPQLHQESGAAYGVRVEATLPRNHYLVVDKNPGDFPMHTTLHTILRRAFQAMERQLKEAVNVLRGRVKMHPGPNAAVAIKRRGAVTAQ